MSPCLIIGIIVALLLLIMLSSTTENYGGPVKRIHRIPLNSCYNICGQYYDNCMAQYQFIDAMDCSRRRTNCERVCQYSDYQRM